MLLGLTLLWGLLLFGGFVYGLRRRDTAQSATPRIPRELRLGSSLCLAVAAWIWYDSLQFSDLSPLIIDFALWFALGASLSCLGDFIVILVQADHALTVGLLAFMTAHVAYINGMLGLMIESIRSPVEADFPTLVIMVAATWLWIMAGMVAWFFLVYRRGDDEASRATPLVYAIVLSVTAGMASTLTLLNQDFILLAFGAALLWLSELIIAPQFMRTQDEQPRWPLLGDLIWLTYGPGQMLLLVGMIVTMLHFLTPFSYGFY
jgi:hypothetical protein